MSFNSDTSINRGNQTSGELLLGGTTDGGFIDFDGTNLQFNTQRDPNTGTFINANKSHGGIQILGPDGGSLIKFATSEGNGPSHVATTKVTINSSGSVSFTESLYIPDAKKVVLGSGSDFQIYHDGSNSYIQNLIGWLNVPLTQNGMTIANADFSNILAKFTIDNRVIFGDGSINGAFGASNTVVAIKGTTSGGEGILQITGKGNSATDNVGKIDFHSYAEADPMCSIRSVRGSADDQGELQIWTNNGGAPTEKFTVSKDGLVYVNKEGYADGGFINGFRTAIQVGQSAVAIGKVATYGGLAMVWVNYVGNIAYDLVSYSLSSVTVLSSQSISGGAAARTYTAVNGVLKLTMSASDTYSVYATEMRTANT
tara:strand:- start:429 stop:1538 length:1110 start_codon:yes stop_codon:yes gene_type:complete